LKKKKDEVTIRSSAAEYLTYVASVGDQQDRLFMSDYDKYLLELEESAKKPQ
jgi:hypothetical protein